MINDPILRWLLEGDISLQYQVYRDLLHVEKPGIRKKIESEGWGLKLLSCRNESGHWGRGFYQPKWTSTHYTLLDLKNLQIVPGNKSITESLDLILSMAKSPDGGIYPIGNTKRSDVCINGMFLNYASYFGVNEAFLETIIDFLLKELMPDGGFNCQSNNKGAVHSSLHSTISVLEGIEEYEKTRHSYRLGNLQTAKNTSQEFILSHHLFRSDKTGQLINPSFLKFYYPTRWFYDILRAMDYFRSAGVAYDPRMQEAIAIIKSKRNKDGLWRLPAHHPGQTHFHMEKAGAPGRWNTLRALRVLKFYDPGGTTHLL